MRKINLTLMLITLALCGCATKPSSTNHVQRLRAHPQYQTTLMTSPEWVYEALTTINSLQRDLELAESK